MERGRERQFLVICVCMWHSLVRYRCWHVLLIVRCYHPVDLRLWRTCAVSLSQWLQLWLTAAVQFPPLVTLPLLDWPLLSHSHTPCLVHVQPPTCLSPTPIRRLSGRRNLKTTHTCRRWNTSRNWFWLISWNQCHKIEEFRCVFFLNVSRTWLWIMQQCLHEIVIMMSVKCIPQMMWWWCRVIVCIASLFSYRKSADSSRIKLSILLPVKSSVAQWLRCRTFVSKPRFKSRGHRVSHWCHREGHLAKIGPVYQKVPLLMWTCVSLRNEGVNDADGRHAVVCNIYLCDTSVCISCYLNCIETLW